MLCVQAKNFDFMKVSTSKFSPATFSEPFLRNLISLQQPLLRRGLWVAQELSQIMEVYRKGDITLFSF